jgi:hypothetical protein
LNLGKRSADECGLGANGNDCHRSVIVLSANFVQAPSSGDTCCSYLKLHYALARTEESSKAEGHTIEVVIVNGSMIEISE